MMRFELLGRTICFAGLAFITAASPTPTYTVAFKSFAPNNTDLFIADADGENESGTLHGRATAEYRWSRETDSAAFDGAYNFPVFVVHNEMWAFHPRGPWRSRDGKTWLRSELPPSGL